MRRGTNVEPEQTELDPCRITDLRLRSGDVPQTDQVDLPAGEVRKVMVRDESLPRFTAAGTPVEVVEIELRDGREPGGDEVQGRRVGVLPGGQRDEAHRVEFGLPRSEPDDAPLQRLDVAGDRTVGIRAFVEVPVRTARAYDVADQSALRIEHADTAIARGARDSEDGNDRCRERWGRLIAGGGRCHNRRRAGRDGLPEHMVNAAAMWGRPHAPIMSGPARAVITISEGRFVRSGRMSSLRFRGCAELSGRVV